jgi:hypothetical protein
MKEHKIKSFQTHLKELKENPVFAKGYEEEKRRIGLAIKIAEFRQQKNLS